MQRNSCFLPYISHHVDSCASYVQTEAVLPHTGERRCNVWKLHFACTTPTLPYPPPMDLQALNSSLSVCKLCEWAAQSLSCYSWDLLVGIHVAIVLLQLLAQSGHAVAQKVQLAASSNVPRSMTRLKDTILIYLFLTSFLPVHSMHCTTPCTHITYSSCCDRAHAVFHVCTSTVQYHIKYTYMNKSFGNKSICKCAHFSNFCKLLICKKFMTYSRYTCMNIHVG